MASKPYSQWLVYFTTFVTLADVAITTDCPDTWIPFDGSCYLFGTDTPLKFVEAEHFCRQHKEGHLVHIDSATENNFIKHYIRAFKPANHWIGLTDEIIEGIWRWYDNDDEATFTDWGHGQPDNAYGHEDCVEIKMTVDGLHWNDAPCDILGEPVCEISGEMASEIIG